MKNNRLKVATKACVLLIIITLTACGKGNKINTDEQEEVLPADIVELRDDQVKLAKIETGTIEFRTMSSSIKVTGIVSVAPQNLATVCMPMGGFVKNTTLMPGNSVRKGQTLAIIENSEFIDLQQNFLVAKNKLTFAEAEYNRHHQLYKDEIYSQMNLQQVTIEYKNLKLLVNSLKQKLTLIGLQPEKLTEDNISRSIPLVSPISGYVKSVNVSIGKSVNSSDILFEIVNCDNLFLELSLFEKDADKVSNGQKLRFYINNEAEQHEAVVFQTGKSINNDKTYKIYARVIGFCKNIIPGMYVNALISSNSKVTMTLPIDAVVSFDDKDYIFAFINKKMEGANSMNEYRMIEIHKGITDGSFIEVIVPKGIDIKATKIVIKGAYNLMSAKKNAGEMSC